MKTYEKPKLIALSLAANDMLCSGCTAATRGSTDAFMQYLNTNYGGADGLLDPSDFGENVFASNEGCQETQTVFESYCKFTAAEQNMPQLFTS